MGQDPKRRVAILIFLLVLSMAAVNAGPTAGSHSAKAPLDKAICPADWVRGEAVPLNPVIIRLLSLDDYVRRNFISGDRIVNLYIGYYRSANKIGAPHSPLVCFMDQGWLLSRKRTISIPINGKDIRVATMIAENGPQKALVVYWFQAFDRAFPGTFEQKLYELWCKLSNRGEENAFVEISVDFGDKSEEDALGVARSFVEAFYPYFLNYITRS